MPLLRLVQADNRSLNIPAGAVIGLEQLNRHKNEGYPEALAFVRFDIGRGWQTALLLNEFEDVAEQLEADARSRKDFLKLHYPDGDAFWLLPEHVLAVTDHLPPEPVDGVELPPQPLAIVDFKNLATVEFIGVREDTGSIMRQIERFENPTPPVVQDATAQARLPARKKEPRSPRK